MKVSHEGEDLNVYPTFVCVDDDGVCRIKLASLGGDYIFLELPELNIDYRKSVDFEYFLAVYGSNHLRSDQFSEVFVKAKSKPKARGGCLLPLSCLLDKDSRLYADSVEFTRGYAFGAVWRLLDTSGYESDSVEVVLGETYSLANFYSDKLVLLVLDEKRVRSYFGEQIKENFFPALAKNKVYEFGVSLRERKVGEEIHSPTEITVKNLSPNLADGVFEFVREKLVFYDSLAHEPLVLFFLQYQVIEIMMGKVFQKAVKGFISKISDEEYSSSAYKTRKLVGKLNDKSTEKYRIKKAFSAFGDECSGALQKLEEESKEFLRNLSHKGANIEQSHEDDDVNVASLLYACRNAVFHGFGSYKIESDDLMPLCEAMSVLLYDMLYDTKEITEPFS